VPPAPAGLPDTPSPEHNPTTPEKVALGKLLFFDKRLSRDKSMACSSCHMPDRGWADGKERSMTVDGKPNLRHTPSLYNVGYQKEFYWDGNIKGLEALIMSNWRGQMSADPIAIAKRLYAIPVYRAHFERTFGGVPTGQSIVQALASFVRTIRSGDSPWDRYEKGDKTAVGPEAIAGYEIFRGKAQCHLCHPPPMYTDYGYHNLGVGVAAGPKDPGRSRKTGRTADAAAFKTPSLRGVSMSPPYFHNGSAPTLIKAISFILAGGFRTGNPQISPKLERVQLNEFELKRLVAFVRSLTKVEKAYKPPLLPAD
jgi:cytochrome c peroxidase